MHLNQTFPQLCVELNDWIQSNEEDFLHLCAFLMVAVGVIVFFVLLFQPATYGRYSNTGRFYSIAIPVRVAWFVQELPAFAIPAVLVGCSVFGLCRQYSTLQLVVLSCFMLHYFQRTFIYSLSIVGGKPTPIYAFILAFIFCTGNGFMQARGSLLLSSYSSNAMTICRVVVGIVLFACGMAINIHSDYVLRNLRKPGEKGYKIPRGGFYEYVSCANFFGEILEWFGYAVASYSTVAFAFAFFTFANLVPRAITHHRWYLKKFENYPKDRRIVIPFLL